MKNSKSKFLSLRFRPAGLLTAAGVVACAATTCGLLGRFSWLLDLFSHFRVQYLIGLTVLGGLLLVLRRRKTAVAFLAFAGANLATVLPLYFGGQNAPPEGASALRAMLLNVNTETGDADRVKQAIQDADPDVLVLQEINSRWVADLSWLESSHPYRVTQPREDNFGVGLFSKLPIAWSEIAYIGSAEVPSILATVDIGQTDLRVIATHPLPPSGREYSRLRNEQLGQLPEYVDSSCPVLLLGDLNVTPWNYHFRKLLRRSGLKDSSRGFGLQPSWPNHSLLLRIPLDHCLHSAEITVVDRRIGPDVSSDHFPVIVDFVVVAEPQENGPAR